MNMIEMAPATARRCEVVAKARKWINISIASLLDPNEKHHTISALSMSLRPTTKAAKDGH
jgi:hypothetical protein